MTTSDLIKRMAKRLGITQKDARDLLYNELNIISEHLADDKNIIIRGFGTFGLRKSRSSKQSKNAFFRASPKFKDFIKSWRPE